MPSFSAKSIGKIRELHPDLQRLLYRAIQITDFTVLEGYRSALKQRMLYDEGKSKALPGQSKHNFLPSLAVDIAPWPVDWDNTAAFYELAGVIKACAYEENIDIVWGGDFKTFFDGPHFELKDV